MNNKQFLARYGDDDHVDKILNTDLNGSDYVRLMGNPSTSSKNIHKILDQRFPIRTEHMKHQNFDDSHVDRLLDSNSKYTVLNLIDSNKLKPHHIDRIVDKNDRDYNHELSNKQYLTSHHIDKILSHTDPIHGTIRELAGHKNISKDALNKIITDGHPDHAIAAFSNYKMSLDDIKYHSENHPNERVRQAAKDYHEMLSDPMLKEAFDSQLTKTEIPKDSMLHKMGSMSAAMIGGDNFQMHKLDKAGYMIQFDKDGATELHHVDDDLQGGYLRSKQPSMRMISTYRGVIKDLLDRGSKVRLVAHHALADKFASISKRIVDKNPEYKMSEPVESHHEITGDKLKSWELSKLNKD